MPALARGSYTSCGGECQPLLSAREIVYTRPLVETASMSGRGVVCDDRRQACPPRRYADRGSRQAALPAVHRAGAARHRRPPARGRHGRPRPSPSLDRRRRGRDCAMARRRPLPDDILRACVAARRPSWVCRSPAVRRSSRRRTRGEPRRPRSSTTTRFRCSPTWTPSVASWTPTRSARRSGLEPRRSSSPISTASRPT